MRARRVGYISPTRVAAKASECEAVSALWLLSLLRALGEHRVEHPFDSADMRVLVRECLVVLMHQHRSVDLEYDEIAGAVEGAVDAEIVEPDAVADRVQSHIMRRVEHRA